jgi:hypothetical protein
MNLPKLEQLVEGIKRRIADPTRQAFAVQMVTDVVKLQIRALSGDDVELEVLAARAKASSVTPSEYGTIMDVMMTWLWSVAGDVARGVLRPTPEWEDRGRRGGAAPARSSD